MKSYNLPNYIRYKEDVKESNKNSVSNDFHLYSRDKLIVKFLPLVENIARKFSTTTQACGVLDITDLTQYGSIGLVQAIDKIEWDTIKDSDNQESTLKSFLSKRIKGAIRRAIDINRGSIRIPEYKLTEMRKDPDDATMVEMFFNSIFQSIDLGFDSCSDSEGLNGNSYEEQYEDKSITYNIDIMNAYLLSLFQKYLTCTEADVLRLSYGLDCGKHSANEIADYLGLEGASSYVRISEIKKQAIQTLINSVDPSQVFDYL
jgi:RNA polymerase sigma factor (sigma-70 family)